MKKYNIANIAAAGLFFYYFSNRQGQLRRGDQILSVNGEVGLVGFMYTAIIGFFFPNVRILKMLSTPELLIS